MLSSSSSLLLFVMLKVHSVEFCLFSILEFKYFLNFFDLAGKHVVSPELIISSNYKIFS